MNNSQLSILNSQLSKKRPELAKVLAEIWALPLAEYAARLWQPPVTTPLLEPELRRAFESEFRRVGFAMPEVAAFSASLERTRILQTATHLTVSEGPTFLALHHLALSGLPPEESYFVGAYSGIPFANAAWSGCLNFSNRFELESVISPEAPEFSALKRAASDRSRDSTEVPGATEQRISLIPGKMREARVYQSRVPEKLTNLLPHLTKSIRNCAPSVKTGDDFTVWASQFCGKQIKQIFPEKSIVYFDLNEVIRNYLLEVLKKTQHPLYRILFDAQIRKAVFSEFSADTPFFTVAAQNKNKLRQESVIFQKGVLRSKNFQIISSPENVIPALKNGTLCPGLFLMFTTLSFLNGLTCFGSFEQVEYLSGFQRKWQSLDILEQEIVRAVNTRALTCGRCVDESGEGEAYAVYPLDLLLGLEWEFSAKQTVSELMKPLLPRLGIFT